MDTLLLWLSFLATAQSHILPRYSNSTINGTSSDASLSTSWTVVGDYIAAGLGLAHESSTSVEESRSAEEVATTEQASSSTSGLTTSSGSSSYSHSESIANTTTSTNTDSETILSPEALVPISSSNVSTPAQTPLRASAIPAGNATASSLALAPVTAATAIPSGGLPLSANYNGTWNGLATGTGASGNSTRPTNATLADGCWAQWSTYWNLYYRGPYTLTTETSILSWNTYLGYDVSTYVETRTRDLYNGAFPTATTTETSWYTISHGVSPSPTSISTRTSTWSMLVPPPLPTCVLPSYVPDCQSSWAAYLDSAYATTTGWLSKPSCTQASITGTLCSTATSDWLDFERMYGGMVGGEASYYNITSTSAGSAFVTSTWAAWFNSTLEVAPGCTLGCQSCRVSGSHVKLLYWSPETSISRDVVTTRTAEMYGTTLTSPTVYVSLDTLWGLNSCSKVGTPMTNVIVPITNTETLSSMYGWARYMPAYALSASFNFTDLYVTPVPDSIYASQPRCASSSHWIWDACLDGANLTLCDAEYPCARTLPYEPVLSVPREVLGLQPEWVDCIGGLNGIYDPPLALQEAVSAALPEFPTAANGGSSSARTTHQSESSPDATTPAAPSPTMSQIVSATNPPASPDQCQTIVPNEPAQTSASNDNSGPETPDAPTNDEQPVETSDDPQTVPSPDTLASNALDVLIQAASNAQASNVPNDGAGQTPNGDAASPQQTQGSNDPAAAGIPLQPAIAWTASDGTIVSAHQDSNNVVVAAPGSTTVVSPKGDPVTFAGQIISQDGSHNLVVDGASIAVPAAAITPTASPAAVWTGQNGNIASAVAQGSAFVIGDSQSSVTVSAGATALFNGQTISAAPANGALLVDGSSVVLPQLDVTHAVNPAAVLTAANGDVPSAIAQGSNIVVHDGQSAVTITPGGSAVIDGQTITAAQDGNAIFADGSTSIVPSASAHGLWTALNGQVFAVTTESNGNIEFIGQNTTFTLTPGGSPTVVDGQTLSALPSGGGMVVDGSSTATPSGVATWTASDGSTITAIAQGSDDVVLVDDGRTITIDADDGSTVLDGHTVSVLAGGNAAIIDGTTISVSRTSSGASRTGTDQEDSTDAATSRPTSTQGGHGTAAAPTSVSGASRRGDSESSGLMQLLGFVAVVAFTWL